MPDGVVFALDMKRFGEKIAALGPAGQAKAESAIVAGAQDMAAAARALVPHKTAPPLLGPDIGPLALGSILLIS
jgi:hypothetical protein